MAKQKAIQILQVKVSDDYAREILTTAVEQGIGYWAEVVSVDRVGADRLIDSARIKDLEADSQTDKRPTRMVSAAGIKRAIALILREGESIGAGGEITRQIMEADGPDAPRCDAVLQVAVFGEVRYS